MRARFALLVSLALIGSACSNAGDAPKQASSPSPAQPATAIDAKRDTATKRVPQPIIRVVVHPQNPFVLYVTDWPSSSERSLLGLPVPTKAPADGKLFVVDLQTGEWRDVPLQREVRRRFGASHPHILFQAQDEPISRTRDEFP